MRMKPLFLTWVILLITKPSFFTRYFIVHQTVFVLAWVTVYAIQSFFKYVHFVLLYCAQNRLFYHVTYWAPNFLFEHWLLYCQSNRLFLTWFALLRTKPSF